MNYTAIQSRLSSLQTKALIAGGIALGFCVFGAFSNSKQFFVSYLFSYVFWLGVALGCLGFLMVHHLTGGRWGFAVRRFYEAAIMTLPLMALLFIPVCFGLRDLYLWTDPQAIDADPVLQHRSAYMNAPAFMIRAAVFFLIWIGVALALNKWSFQQDATTGVEPTRKLRTLSGPGIALYPVTATFVLVDWVLSLEPDWYSTMFVVLIIIGQMLAGLAFGIMLLALLYKTKPMSDFVTTTHFHHLGMLLLAFVMLWTYMSFGELLIIYSGNLPHEIVWYLHRIAGDWKLVVWFLFLFHFLVPFFLLLSRELKRNVPVLATIAGVIFFAHIVNTYWLIAPSFNQTGIRLHWLDFAAPIGVGGIWIAAFTGRLKSRPLLVQNDPRQYPNYGK
jgi:hypothetical protein